MITTICAALIIICAVIDTAMFLTVLGNVGWEPHEAWGVLSRHLWTYSVPLALALLFLALWYLP